MRNLRLLDMYRVKHPLAGYGDEECGAFLISSKIDNAHLRVIASTAAEWDHVSVSRANRCPNWTEWSKYGVSFLKMMNQHFSIMLPIADYIDGSKYGHPYCLHLWRPLNEKIPVPSKWMVGGMSFDEAEKHAKEAGL